MGTFRTTWTLTIIITIYRVAAGSPTGGAATRTGSLDHVNKLAPEFDTTEMRVSVKEGSPLGQVVVKITAYDRDAGDEGVITYSLHYNQGMFRIDPVSGVVSVASHNIDRETEDTYVLLVQAEDDGGLFSTMTLIITIEDINDNPPIFGQTTYSAILPENEMYFTQPLQLKATDDDEPGTENSDISYSLSSSSDPPGLAGHFHINLLTGNITVVQALDFDNISFSAGHPGEIILTAMAKDHGRVHLNSTAVVIITLVDTNDNIPQFENDTYHKTVPENISTGSEVVVVHARDSDSSAPNNHVFYFLETGGRDDFAIDHVTGVITVVGKLDRETLANYSLHVMARDQGADPLYSYCTVYINVSDINDEPPRFREKHATTAESDGVFGSIYNMGAVDLDLDARLKYSILWNESYGLSASLTMITGDQLWSWIDIDSENGILLEKRPFDSSHVIRFYLTLLVQDLNAFNPKPQQDTAIVAIIITGANRRRRSVDLSNVSNEMQEHQKWEAKISFLAANIHYLEVTNAQRIVYEKILVNEGSGYSNTTGTFTCSQTGKYVFEVHTFAPPNSSVWLALYHQVTRVTTLEVHEGEDSKAESVTAVLQLLQSDEVYVMSTPGHSSRLFGAPDAILNTFSGYLLSPASE
ncbi:cadherin-23-like isoform X2 [Pomacea canaliculata]|uniref:cadherin-23-like isoform X2 n=1 Tax=Pomacea canaliculata TaxID=400727 RepID=UPI000D739899|nr:cadherin-23-like isoform X2 [Pomacea canaliculata]